MAFGLRLEQMTSGATIADSLMKMADAVRADLIVLGSRSRPAPLASLFGSVGREIAGSTVGEEVGRRSGSPVLVAPTADPVRTGPDER